MTEPYYQDDAVTLHHGDCLDVLRTLPEASVDAVATDPPYGLEFMGKGWDSFGGDTRQPFRGEIQTPDNPFGRSTVRYGGTSSLGGKHAEAMRAFQQWCEAWAVECLRVLKPGGHLLAFGGSRTWHRLATAVEDAGFEIRDSIAWLYGSGFPKSRNLDGEWQGWGTALKPAFEPVVVGRKPLAGTVAATVLAHGTGALNIDACRVGDGSDSQGPRGDEPSAARRYTDDGAVNLAALPGPRGGSPSGRWPTNVVLDESQAAELDEQTGVLTSGKMRPTHTTAARSVFGQNAEGGFTTMETYGDSGGASRFFPTFRYEAKAPTAERPRDGEIAHPTVKPLDLMRWLVRLVTPPGGVVLEPFAGSGTTAEACVVEGFRCIAIEREADYLPLITQRLTKPIALTLDIA